MSVLIREIGEDIAQFSVIKECLYWGVLARSFEETARHFAKKGCRMFDVFNGDNIIGFIFLIVNGNRSILTLVSTVDREPEILDCEPEIFECRFRQEDIRKLGDRSCVNFPLNRYCFNLRLGEQFWEIQQYVIDYDELDSRFSVSSTSYAVAMIGEEDNIDEILAFDYNLFSLSDRREFIQMCRENSDAVFVVRCDNEIKGFGMLSKPVYTSLVRLLGPVYATDDEAANCIIDAIYDAVAKGFSVDVIVAYVPKITRSPLLIRRGFGPCPRRVWGRFSSCHNYNINTENIVALGSLAFDVC